MVESSKRLDEMQNEIKKQLLLDTDMLVDNQINYCAWKK